MQLAKENKKSTYANYLTWPENERWEIIEGAPFMQTAPSWQHQALSRELLTQFSNFLKGKHCQVFASPFDLRLPNAGEEDDDTTNVYQPDLVVVCDQSRLKGTGYHGTPELVIEILSPTTIRNDKIWKFNKYESSGVKEYWIVEPEGKFITVFTLQENNRYGRPEAYTESDELRVSIFPELQIDLESVFIAIR